MALNLKEKLLKMLSGSKQDEPKQLTLTQKELDELIEKRAAEMLDKELASLDNAFLKEVSEGMKSVKIDNVDNTQQDKTQEEKVKEILNNKEVKE